MLKQILLAILTVALLGIAYAGSALYQAHRQIDGITPQLPDSYAILNSVIDDGMPVSLMAHNTATQNMPLSSVLSSVGESEAEEFFDMSFPVFVVTWADGRQFVIDAGLSAKTADPFGEPAEMLGAAQFALA